MNFRIHMKMILVMVIMLLIVGLIFGGIFGYKAFLARMSRRAMATQKMPPVTVTAVKAGVQTWQPQLQAGGRFAAHGNLRAIYTVDARVPAGRRTCRSDARAGDKSELHHALRFIERKLQAVKHPLFALAELGEGRSGVRFVGRGGQRFFLTAHGAVSSCN